MANAGHFIIAIRQGGIMLVPHDMGPKYKGIITHKLPLPTKIEENLPLPPKTTHFMHQH